MTEDADTHQELATHADSLSSLIACEMGTHRYSLGPGDKIETEAIK